MPAVTRAEYLVGELLVTYLSGDDQPHVWGLRIIPASQRASVVSPREWLESPAVRRLPQPWNLIRAWEIDPLVHLHLRGEAQPGGFSNGRTLRNSATTAALRVRSHEREELADGKTCLRTVLVHPRGLHCTHELTIDPGCGVVTVETRAENHSPDSLTLGALSAFSLGGITPFAPDDAPGRLWIHRCRSAWSAEGRLDSQPLEHLQLERSWNGYGVRTERFGQAGSLPVNGWFPLVAVEDRTQGVTWAAQLSTPGTWHLELYRRADTLSLGGGGADRLLGEWSRTLAPGETHTAPPAFLTAVAGDFDAACDRFIKAAAARGPQPAPQREREMPIVFNEWCTSWGRPTHASLVTLADRLAGSGVTYLVIDDGWAERPGDQFQQNGDWRVNLHAFPSGLRATTEAIRACGLIPGLWFEFEAINPGSSAWDETSHQLHRDGVPLQVGTRRFWDFRDPWVHEFLADRVLARLRDDGFGYLKVDYNDSIGPGVDGPDSPGENLRQHLAGVQRFFARLRSEMPDLVIENCSSGGHRLEPSMMALTSMSSFSDAHETPDIPVIAADLSRLVPAAQKQIWAVLRAADSPERLCYSLAATFLGRMCLSGDPDVFGALGRPARAVVTEAVRLYREVAPILRDARIRIHRTHPDARTHPRGHQLVTLEPPGGADRLVVWHRFTARSQEPSLPLERGWKLHRDWSANPGEVDLTPAGLLWRPGPDWTGGVVWLKR